MKILWLSHLVPYPPKAGVLLRAHYLVKELSKYHDVHLLAFNQRMLMTPYFSSYDEGTEVAMCEMKMLCEKVKFIDCPMDKSKLAKYFCALKSLASNQPYNINWLRDSGYADTIKQWHSEEKYDLIHCDTISLAPYVADICDAKLSLDHHNVESHMLIRRAELESNPIKKFYFLQEGKKLEKSEQVFCPKFDTNLTCSELDAERFQAFVPNASFTEIPNGVDITVFKPDNGETDPATFIFVGTLDWYPNTRAVRFLAEHIWPLIKKSIPGAKVNIIGAGAPDDLLELSAREENFNVLGFVDDLAPYLHKATAYLCPIDDGGGTKLKLLDAFAAGKAVIANEVACEGLNVSDGEQVLFASTKEQYIEKIFALLNNPKLKSKIESNARQHVVDHFSFSSIGKSLADHFTLLSQRND